MLRLQRCEQLDVLRRDPSALQSLTALDLSFCTALWDISSLVGPRPPASACGYARASQRENVASQCRQCPL